MHSGIRAVAMAAMVRGGFFRDHPERPRRSRSRAKCSCSWATSSSPRDGIRTRSMPISARSRPPNPPIRAPRAPASCSRRCASPSSRSPASRRKRWSGRRRSIRRRWPSAPTRSGRRGSSTRPSRDIATRSRTFPISRAAGTASRGRSRRAAGWTRRWTRRRRRSRRRRATSRFTTPSAPSTSGCTSTKRRPAPSATTSTCSRTRTPARRPTGRGRRSSSCGRSASACRSKSIRAPTNRSTPSTSALVNDKVVVRAKVNDGSFQDFVVDTGAENTILSRPTAQRLGITPITYTLSAGVGDVGLRGLQLARINTLELGPLKLRNVPCLIKDPPLRNLPVKEAESLSPLALGFSMIIDYKTRKITFGKQPAGGTVRLRAAAAAAPAGDRPRHGRRQASGELRRRHRRGSDFDQHAPPPPRFRPWAGPPPIGGSR